jgi:hypothetical protein
MCPFLLTQESLHPIFSNLDDIELIVLIHSVSKKPRWRTKLLFYSRVPALCVRWVSRDTLGRGNLCLLGNRSVVYCKLLEFAERGDCPQCRFNTWTTTPYSGTNYTIHRLLPCRPNVEAAKFLIEKVWPKVHIAMPTAWKGKMNNKQRLRSKRILLAMGCIRLVYGNRTELWAEEN